MSSTKTETKANMSLRRRNGLVRGCDQKIAFFTWKINFFQEAADAYFLDNNAHAVCQCEKSMEFYRKAKTNALEMKERFSKLKVED